MRRDAYAFDRESEFTPPSTSASCTCKEFAKGFCKYLLLELGNGHTWVATTKARSNNTGVVLLQSPNYINKTHKASARIMRSLVRTSTLSSPRTNLSKNVRYSMHFINAEHGEWMWPLLHHPMTGQYCPLMTH